VATDDAGLDVVLEVIEQEAGFLMPDRVEGKRCYRYSRQRAREQIAKKLFHDYCSVILWKKAEVEVSWHLRFGGVSGGFTLLLYCAPLGFFRKGGDAEARCQQVARVVRALCKRLGPVEYGFAHSEADALLGSDPRVKSSRSPPGAYEVYWLNVYGKQLVEKLGRERVLSVPGHVVEELPCGGVLWLSRRTVEDFDSEEARRAQARCLVHLRPELRLEEVERGLLERSQAFQPVEKRFEPDIAELIERIIERMTKLATRRKEIEKYNAYRPPPVEEWGPAEGVKSDVGKTEAEGLEGRYAQQAEYLIALLHTQAPSVLGQEEGSVVDVDEYVWAERWADFYAGKLEERQGRLVPILGGYLGELLVKHLGGRWVPRKALVEAAVVVGDKAWYPFLRASRLLDAPDKPLDFTLSQFYREAARQARNPRPPTPLAQP
jgi:hypothetical protein